MQVWSKTVTTRKPSVCWGCEWKIPPGTLVTKTTNADAGQFVHTTWCKQCQELLTELRREDSSVDEDGMAFGVLREFMEVCE